MAPRRTVVDRLERPLHDLRLSVTDRCNFRCRYCMPREMFGPDHAFAPRADLLTFEEITRLARIFASYGVRKIRLTGGEPLLRRDLPDLVAMIAAVDGIDDLAMTTNGSLLAEHAAALRAAGLQRVTVSLDSVDPSVFAAMTDSRVPLTTVLAGIAAATDAGFAPVKLNSVVRRGVNDAGLLDLVDYARGGGHILRFIEYMDVGGTEGWRLDEVVPSREIVETIARRYPLEVVAPNQRGEVARRWRFSDGLGEIGVISSVTQPFCGDCTRARLTATGEMFTCLFAAVGRDLRAPLRAGASDDEIAAVVGGTWASRDDRYSELRSAGTVDLPRAQMSYLGG